jgi:hypothetical protein
MADLDPDLSLNGVLYRSNMKLYYTQKNLDKYFKPKKDRKISAEFIEKTMKGIGYTKTATYYLFIKKN